MVPREGVRERRGTFFFGAEGERKKKKSKITLLKRHRRNQSQNLHH